jgi:hypothetical protein
MFSLILRDEKPFVFPVNLHMTTLGEPIHANNYVELR